MDPAPSPARLDSALWLAQQLSVGAVSAETLVRRALDRIDATREGLQAFVEVFRGSALRAARRVDAARARGAKLPFFAGVPLAIKDQNFIRFHTSRFGSAAMLAFPSPMDDAIVSRLRRAGFVLVGATSLSELGVIPVTENLVHPPARNPWNTAHTPGGSSGGSAAAVAAGLVPLAHGADGGGSLRIPAAFCGLFTLKPSRGLLPNVHFADPQRSLYIDGPLGTSALDVAAGLDAMCGHGGPARWTQAARQAPTALTIGVCTETTLTPTEPHLQTAVRRVADALARLGHRVQAAPALNLTFERFLPLWQRLVANSPLLRPARAHPITAWLHREGRKLDPRAIWQQHLAGQAEVDAWFGEADLCLLPTTAVVAPLVGLGAPGGDPRADFARFVPFAAYTAPFNVSGQPAASLPVGLSDQGLPLGVQLVGRRGEDATVLAACRQLELAGVAVPLVSPLARSLVEAEGSRYLPACQTPAQAAAKSAEVRRPPA
jgi:amidase